MTEKEINELYTRLASQYDFGIDALLAKQVIDANLAVVTKENFYNSLDEEKLRTAGIIRGYYETIRHYMRQMTCKDMCR